MCWGCGYLGYQDSEPKLFRPLHLLVLLFLIMPLLVSKVTLGSETFRVCGLCNGLNERSKGKLSRCNLCLDIGTPLNKNRPPDLTRESSVDLSCPNSSGDWSYTPRIVPLSGTQTEGEALLAGLSLSEKSDVTAIRRPDSLELVSAQNELKKMLSLVKIIWMRPKQLSDDANSRTPGFTEYAHLEGGVAKRLNESACLNSLLGPHWPWLPLLVTVNRSD